MRKMASISLTSLLLLLFVSSAFGQKPANMLEGTWRMISQTEVRPDTTIVRTTVPPEIKILNSTHFAWGYQSDNGE